MPKADVSRRFSDNDPVGRVASLLIERALDYEIEHYPDFRSAMKNSVEDRFLGGRGVAWVRYDPHIKKQDMPENGWQITEDVEEEDYGDIHNQTAGMEEEPEEIDYECAPTDYVHWKDFGHTPARTWEEVTAVWRWVYMSREALIERFGEEAGRKIPTNESPEGLTKYGQTGKKRQGQDLRAVGQGNRQGLLVQELRRIADERDDPLELDGFFPCSQAALQHHDQRHADSGP
jgi:hypothetical protein